MSVKRSMKICLRICCVSGVLRLEKKTIASIFLACLPSCKHGDHMLGLSEVHKR